MGYSIKKIALLALGIVLVAVTANFGRPAPTYAQGSADACAAAPKPHLQKGTQAQVTNQTSTDLPGAYLKPGPSHDGPVIRYLPLGTVVNVVDGPTCGSDKGYWWQVKLGDLTGWLAEASDQNYLLDPFTTGTALKLPDTTFLTALPCIKPNTPPSAPTTSGTAVMRVVFGLQDGSLGLSDNGGNTQVITSFSSPLLGMDISPDGSAAAVANYNGLYWVDLKTGKTVMLADNAMLGLSEDMWMNRVTWMPDGNTIAVEIMDRRDNAEDIELWGIVLDGSSPPFRADTGAQPEAGVHKTAAGDKVVVVSANDISPFPKNKDDDPKSLLEYIPKSGESGDARELVTPAIEWSLDGKGFYTYIPVSDTGGPTDTVGGKMWFVPFQGEPQDMGKLPDVKAADYVIPSPDGKDYLIGHGTSWAIRDTKTNSVVQALPPLYILFDWTPDGKGVVYNLKTGETKYLGIDGSTTSPYIPDANNLYELKWLPDGTLMYVVQGADGKLSFSTEKQGAPAKFLGLSFTEYSFAGILLAAAPDHANAPESCVAPASGTESAAQSATAAATVSEAPAPPTSAPTAAATQ